MEYTVVEDDSYGEFITNVNEHLKQGWKLQGGVCAVIYYDSDHSEAPYWYHQAMVRGGE